MSNLSKIIFLILLNVFVLLLCFIWFSYLGILEVKPVISMVNKAIKPVASMLKLPVDETADSNLDKDDLFLLENERIKKKEMALDIRFSNLKIEEEKIESKKQDLVEKISEIGNLKQEYSDKENILKERVIKFEDRNANYKQIAKNLGSITPDEAVKILESHQDQDIIEIFRAEEAIAAETGAFSLVPTWSGLMDPKRVATIQRKMTQKPEI